MIQKRMRLSEENLEKTRATAALRDWRRRGGRRDVGSDRGNPPLRSAILWP